MKDIYKTGFGWISPNGDVLGCSSFGHLEALLTWDNIKNNYPEVAEILEGVEETRISCQENADRGEHPEWHYYEMALDSAEYKVRDLLLKYGYVRIGASGYAQMIEAEGSPSSIKAKMAAISRIVKEYNIENGVDYHLRVHNKI